ncbi:unnamed protein product [Vicia faba]|uniref:Uncharacterized protein n=1 Tax=Vicia faba TaxID=3906 RepID=A0AAV0YKJ7_VICFA|nr:unnamed protein product [Vicia faba]
MFYIETILKHLGIKECFSEINPCPPNMCKGLIIDRIPNTVCEVANKRFIYLGDGTGDYCPSLRFRERDFVMPRKNFPVWDLICQDPSLVKAEIHAWSDGEELEQVLMKLVNKTTMDEHARLIASDCKPQTLPIHVLDSLPNCGHKLLV